MVTNKGFDKSEITIICGTTIGNPKMAIKAELPPALLAMADSSVNNNDKLIPPVITINKNLPKLRTGLPNNKVKISRATKLIPSISKTL